MNAPLSGPLVWTLAWRFLRGHKSRLLAGTALAALLATAVGVLAMVIAMALMTGYREDLQAKLIRGNAAVVVAPLSDARDELPAAVETMRAEPRVSDVSAVQYGQGSLSVPAGAAAEVTLRGVDPGSSADFTSGGGLSAGDGQAGVGLGRELAGRLGVGPGDSLRLAAIGYAEGSLRFRYRSVRVAELFDTGFSEFDQSWVILDRGALQELTGTEAADELFELRLADPGDAPAVAARLREALGPAFVISDWRELNRELFTALKLQQLVLFLVLGLIVLVSTFNVASTLVVLVRERMREIGALAAVGFAPGGLRRVFLGYGLLLGAAGALAGLGLGAATVWILDTFELIRFDPEVASIYFIRSVPFRLRSTDLAAIVLFTLGITFLACWLPSRRAARVDPAVALRYE
ncbi:MAG: ABC transporter permease [Thermoanaerobaculia bacterium]